MKKSKIYKRLFMIIVLIYVIFTIANQQKTLNKYDAEIEQLSIQIDEEEENKEELAKKKDNVNSLEYIEETARKMLDMYYPNETVYVNGGM